MVSMLISSFSKVSTCRRKKHEHLSVFVSRFRGLAAEHLMHSNASTSSQIGEVLAITLLNNANLEEGTLTNAKLQLISLAESRSKEETQQETTQVSKSLITSLAALYNSFADAMLPPDRSVENFNLKRFLLNFRADVATLVKKLHNLLSQLTTSSSKSSTGDSVSSLVLSEQKTCRLYLEDAVAVLGNLNLTSGVSSSFNIKEVENLINRNVQKALMSVNTQQVQPTLKTIHPRKLAPNASKTQSDRRNPRNASQKRKRGNLLEGQEEDVCFDCGLPGHRRGESDCKSPSFLTRRIQAKRLKRSEDKAANPTE